MMWSIAGDILDRLEAEACGRLERGTSTRVFEKKVVLCFRRDELLYDIKNLAYVEGDVMKVDSEHDRHQVMDVVEDGNIDRVTRVMGDAVSHCTELLLPYTKVEVDDEECADDSLEVVDEYRIVMRVPDEFSKSTIDRLKRMIHEYVVAMVLADWLSITHYDEKRALRWEAKAQKLEGELDSALYTRTKRVRRTQSPF